MQDQRNSNRDKPYQQDFSYASYPQNQESNNKYFQIQTVNNQTLLHQNNISKAIPHQSQQLKDQINHNNKEEKKQNSNRNIFYEKILIYSENIPKDELEVYSNKIKSSQKIKSWLDLSLFAYIGYLFFSLKKPWFELTTTPRLIGIRALFLILAPDIWYSKRMNRDNYTFYNRNKYLLEKLLSQQDKIQIKLDELLKSHQY